MRIGIPKEPAKGQKLVSATPDTVGKLIKLGYEVVVEAGAGALASYPDQQYRDAGAEVVGPQEVWQADIVTTLDKPTADKMDALRQGTVLISRLAPRVDSSIAEVMNAKGVTAVSMDAVPRISRAQSMDVLSSMRISVGIARLSRRRMLLDGSLPDRSRPRERCLRQRCM